jgi:hypothetical protein
VSYLPLLEFACNNAPQASTGMSPFFMNYARDPHVPSSLFAAGAASSPVPAADDFLDRMSRILSTGRDRLLAAQQLQAEYANKHRRDESFRPGDLVMVNTAHIRGPFERNRPAYKLQARFEGPFRIEATVGPVAYRIAFPPTMQRFHPVVHVSWLRRFHGNTFAGRDIAPPPPVVLPGGDAGWVVDQILKHKWDSRRKDFVFLTRWLGYANSEASWEPRRSFVVGTTFTDALLQYFEAHPETRTRTRPL